VVVVVVVVVQKNCIMGYPQEWQQAALCYSLQSSQSTIFGQCFT